jgi:nucleoside-diphosphate-sugar epimerase
MSPRARSPEPGQGNVLVTGSSGFIGSWLVELLAANGHDITGLDIAAPLFTPARHISADIRDLPQLSMHSRLLGQTDTVVHLAAKAEAVTPFAAIPDLIATNVVGTLHTAQAFAPPLFVFASSCAVYGNTLRSGVSAAKHPPCPVGLYGDSKATGEMILADWARQTGNRAVAFRFGNVIGARCRGLIPYLVRHALRFPDGDVPAQMRGNGRIIRDYVPVRHLIQVIAKAITMEWKPGSFQVFNIGSGQGLSNGEVARRVQRILRQHGYKLAINMKNPIANGEAQTAVLKLQETERKFGIRTPNGAEVDLAIEDAVRYWLDHSTSSASDSSAATGSR